jgi:hypothetical protein
MERRSLAEQLQGLGPRQRQSGPSIRPVCQIEIAVGGRDKNAVFAGCQTAVLKWMGARSGRPLPLDAWKGNSFQLEDVGAQFAAAVALEEPRYWAARLDDADRSLPRRTWVTEIALAQSTGNSVLLGARLHCVSRGDDLDFFPSIPGFVRQIAGDYEVTLDGRVVEYSNWVVEAESDVDDLVRFLNDPRRRHDVIVFSLPDGRSNPSETIVAVEPIRSAVLGAAHTAIITGPASYWLTHRVGKEFSVFQQAVRTYRPGLDFERDEPFRHPLALAQRIARWDEVHPGTFSEHLVRQCLATTIMDREREVRLPPFAQVRTNIARLDRERARDAGAKDGELLSLAIAENEDLRSQLLEQKETNDGLLVVAQSDTEVATREAEELRSQNAALRSRLAHLEAVAFAKSPESVPTPSDFEGLEEWASKYLAGSVVLHNRAIRAAKKSNFENVGLAYEALLLLRDHYVPMRREGEGGIEKKRRFEQECSKLGLEDAASFATTRYGEEGEAYRIEFSGERYLLDRHLKGSNSRDARFGFRLYYFWHDEREQVVVGWFPSHLPTRIS